MLFKIQGLLLRDKPETLNTFYIYGFEEKVVKPNAYFVQKKTMANISNSILYFGMGLCNFHLIKLSPS